MDDRQGVEIERLEAETRVLYERCNETGSLVLGEQYQLCVEELERRGVTVRESLVFDGGPARTGLLLTRSDVSILYWALETLDAEVGLNEEEQPIFARVARHVDREHGIPGEPERVRDERV